MLCNCPHKDDSYEALCCVIAEKAVLFLVYLAGFSRYFNFIPAPEW